VASGDCGGHRNRSIVGELPRPGFAPFSVRLLSTPVFSSQGKVIATFAMYHREPRRPSPHDQEIIDLITHLAGVAIQQKLAQETLQRVRRIGRIAEADSYGQLGLGCLQPEGALLL